MALDADAAAALAKLEELGVPDFAALSPAEVRACFDPLFATPAKARAPVERVEDRRVPGPGGGLPLRLYRPGGAALPAVLHLLGGGWVFGDLETHDGFCRHLARESGCAVLALHYRRSPEHPFPAALEDAFAALGWLAQEAPGLGLDPERLGVIGDSAGGGLAAALAQYARDRDGPRLRAQVLTYPALDPRCETASARENAEGYFLTTRSMRWFWRHYLGPALADPPPYAAPGRTARLEGLPPALLVTAEYDPLRDEGEAYAGRLADAGVPVRLRRYPGVFHGFLAMAHQIARGGEAIREEARFLRERLEPGGAGR